MNYRHTILHIYPVIYFQHSSVKVHNLCTTIRISVFVISLTYSWNRKRGYAHAACYMHHFFPPGCMIMPYSEWLAVVRVHGICLLHACGCLRFEWSSRLSVRSCFPKWSEAKPSQAHRAWQLFPVFHNERLWWRCRYLLCGVVVSDADLIVPRRARLLVICFIIPATS
jgi:hypothetical protein